MSCMTPGLFEIVWPLGAASFFVAVGFSLGLYFFRMAKKKVVEVRSS